MTVFEQIAVGFDESEQGGDALRLGALLARVSGATLRVVRVDADRPEGGNGDAAERIAREARDALGETGAPVEALARRGESPARALHELAAGGGADLIVLGSTHRAGLGRVLPGGVAERLLSGAPCPVAIAPRGYRPDELRVLAVGFDGSPEAEGALRLADQIGHAAEAALRVIAVRHAPASPGSSRVEALATMQDVPDLEDQLSGAVSALDPALRALPMFERGDPAAVLAQRAEEGVDLLLVGSRGYGPLRAVLLGSVSSRLVREAPCPVLVTPRTSDG